MAQTTGLIAPIKDISLTCWQVWEPITPTKLLIGFPFKHNEQTRNGIGCGVGTAVGTMSEEDGGATAGADGGETTEGDGFDVGQPHRCCAAANACAVKH